MQHVSFDIDGSYFVSDGGFTIRLAARSRRLLTRPALFQYKTSANIYSGVRCRHESMI
jgi:hypothetical protein